MGQDAGNHANGSHSADQNGSKPDAQALTPQSPEVNAALNRLRQVVMRQWWTAAGLLWLTIGAASLWMLRPEIQQLRQFFTWTALRYGLAYNPIPSVGLGLCIGLTVALLVSESRYLLWGIPTGERRRLMRQLAQIQQAGPRHRLWQQVWGPPTQRR